jgi:hypothetical protein
MKEIKTKKKFILQQIKFSSDFLAKFSGEQLITQHWLSKKLTHFVIEKYFA